MTQPASGTMLEERRLPLFKLRLYVRGASPKMRLAQENLRTFCNRYLADRHAIELVDIETQPERADDDDIIAVPTLVRVAPGPLRRIVGDFSNVERLSQSLDVPLG